MSWLSKTNDKNPRLMYQLRPHIRQVQPESDTETLILVKRSIWDVVDVAYSVSPWSLCVSSYREPRFLQVPIASSQFQPAAMAERLRRALRPVCKDDAPPGDARIVQHRRDDGLPWATIEKSDDVVRHIGFTTTLVSPVRTSGPTTSTKWERHRYSASRWLQPNVSQCGCPTHVTRQRIRHPIA